MLFIVIYLQSTIYDDNKSVVIKKFLMKLKKSIKNPWYVGKKPYWAIMQ